MLLDGWLRAQAFPYFYIPYDDDLPSDPADGGREGDALFNSNTGKKLLGGCKACWVQRMLPHAA